MLTFPRNTFAVGDVVLVKVKVSLRSDPNDVDVTNTTITLIAGSTPKVRIIQGASIFVNPQEKLILSGEVKWPPELDVDQTRQSNYALPLSVEARSSLLWSEMSGALQLLSERENVYASPLDRDFVVIKPGFLIGGRHYKFRLSAGAGTNHGASADIKVIVNRPPHGGFFKVEPLSGVALLTEFELSLHDWADDEQHYPLKYKFYVGSTASSTSKETNISALIKDLPYPLNEEALESNREFYRLQNGLLNDSYFIQLSAAVFDSLGAHKSAHLNQSGLPVRVQVNPSSVEEAKNFLTERFDATKVNDMRNFDPKDVGLAGAVAEVLYPKETCHSDRVACLAILEQLRPSAKNLLDVLVRSESVTTPSKFSLEQQAVTLSRLSAFVDSIPEPFLESVIVHANRIVNSAFSAKISLTRSSVFGLHNTFENLVVAGAPNFTSINKSWGIGEQINLAVENFATNALLSYSPGEDPLVISGRHLSLWAKVDSMKDTTWIPNRFVNLNAGPIGFSLPAQGLSTREAESPETTTPRQLVAVAQRKSSSRENVEGLIIGLRVYDTMAANVVMASLKHPIEVVLPTLAPANADMRCLHWDAVKQRWSQRGTFISRKVLHADNHSNTTSTSDVSKWRTSTLTCSTTHLTSFFLETGMIGFDPTLSNRKFGNALAPRFPERIEEIQTQLLFVYDTANFPVISVILGVTAFHLILVGISVSRQRNKQDDAFKHVCMERFLNTGTTRWTGFRRREDNKLKLNAVQFMISFAEKALRYHPAIAWLQIPTQLSFPRIFYALLFWNANSILFLASTTTIGVTELDVMERLPLAWIASVSSLVAIMCVHESFSRLLVWESVHLGNYPIVRAIGCVCCGCLRCGRVCLCWLQCFPCFIASTSTQKSRHKNYRRAARRKLAGRRTSSHSQLWVEFQRLRHRCLVYVVEGSEANSSSLHMREGSTGSTGKMAIHNVYQQASRTYEKYAYTTLLQQDNPYPRGIFLNVCQIQAVWRGHVVRVNRAAFADVKLARRSSAINIEMTKSWTKRVRSFALVVQTLVICCGIAMSLLSTGQLSNALHKQFALCGLILGLVLVVLSMVSANTLKYCNGPHMATYMGSNLLATSLVGLFCVVLINVSRNDPTTLSVVTSEWEALFSTSSAGGVSASNTDLPASMSEVSSNLGNGADVTTDEAGSLTKLTASATQLKSWQDEWNCCGILGSSRLAVMPCSSGFVVLKDSDAAVSLSTANASFIGCEAALADHVAVSLTSLRFISLISFFFQVLSLSACCILSSVSSFRTFLLDRMIRALEMDSEAMAQSAAPSSCAKIQSSTQGIFTGLTRPITYKAAKKIQSAARMYLARRRCFRKKEYDRIVLQESSILQLQTGLSMALTLSAVMLDCVNVWLSIKFDPIREMQWRQTVESGFVLLYLLLVPLTSLFMLLSEAQWLAWTRKRLRVWHEL
jgi:hypothetical protein